MLGKTSLRTSAATQRQHRFRAPLGLLTDRRLRSDSLDKGQHEAEILTLPLGEAFSLRPLGGSRKRAVDIVLTLGIVLAGLALIVAVAVVAMCCSPGPVFYAHRRVGFRGREFNCLKFRTMAVNGDELLKKHLEECPEAAAEWERDRKLRNDPRVTLVGKFLRKTSLDELPQLLNVLRGEMSLVGPRPVVAEELERYGARRSAYLATRPGLTGLWQVSGRNLTTYERRTELDEIYVKTWSIGRDVRIIVRTIPELLMSSRAF